MGDWLEKKIKKFLLEAMLFMVICFLPLWIQLLLPQGFFYYNGYSAIERNQLASSCPFYKNIYLEKTDIGGELGYRTKYAVQRTVVYQTDSFGYRNYPDENREYDVVVIGRSNAAGAQITQEKTLVSLLNKKTDLRFYSFAPSTINDFFADERFKEKPPRIVVFESIERKMFELPDVNKEFKPESIGFDNPIMDEMVDFADSMMKLAPLRWAQGNITDYFFPKKVIANDDINMLFIRDAFDAQEKNLAKVDEIAEKFVHYRDALKENGIEFVFVPIPDKETIYYQYLPEEYSSFRRESPFLSLLMQKLEEKGVNYVDVLAEFKKNKDDGYLYLPDDAHWSEKGIEITSELVEQKIIEIE